MIISLIKEEPSTEYIKKMEKKYGTIENLEKALNETRRTLLHVDLENWKYLAKNPKKTIRLEEIIFTKDLNIGENEFELLNTIKKENPKSVRDLALKMNKDPGNVQNKINHLADEGLVSFEKGLKNSKKPFLDYDKIEIAI